MKRWLAALFVVIMTGISASPPSEKAPTEGHFTDYYFVDRWGQGVFGYLFVSPDLHKALLHKKWHPIKIYASEISQPMNPGGAMIQKVDTIQALPAAKLRLDFRLDKQSLVYGTYGFLTVTITNNWEKPVDLYRRDLDLTVTVHKRGETPKGKPKRDEIYDCFVNGYSDFKADGLKMVRATYSVRLLTDKGDIKMRDGCPGLFIKKKDGIKRAGIYDEDHCKVAPGTSVSFQYVIGEGWFVNEYELQLRYRPREKELGTSKIMSVPLPLDVTRPAGRQVSGAESAKPDAQEVSK